MSRFNLGSMSCLVGCVVLAFGCGRAPEQSAGKTSTQPATSKAPDTTPASDETPVTTNTASAGTTSSAAEGKVTAEVESIPDESQTAAAPANNVAAEALEKPSPVAETPTKVKIDPPTTARAAIEKINLQQLPKLSSKQELESGPTYLYYSANATLNEADKFYEKLFQEAGWRPTDHLVTSTDQYIDRLFTKDGYFVRLSISPAGTAGELAVNLSSLGNFDMRSLPKTSDAEDQVSTAVMAGHKSSQSIAVAAEALTKQMIDRGWQIANDMQAGMEEVPHYRSIRFRKEAIRVNLGLVKDPANPAEKIAVFYHAEHVIPMDIPTYDHRQPLRLDPMANEGSFGWQGDRAKMVELLEKHGEPLGWQLVNKPAYLDEKATALFIKTLPNESYGESTMGLAARYVESQGKYSISLQRSLLPKLKSTAADNNATVAQSDDATEPDAPSASTQPSAVDLEIAKVQSATDELIKQELSKALGSLSSKPADIQALQAKAAELQAKFGQIDADDATEPNSENEAPEKAISFDVADDKEPVAPADQKLTTSVCKIKFNEKEYVLNHCLTFAKVEDGKQTKIIMFSNQPLAKAAVEKKFFAKETVSMFEATGRTNPSATAEFVISEDYINLNMYVDGLSYSTNSSDMKSTVRLHNGKLQGRIMLDKPFSVQDKSLTFSAEVAQAIAKQ